MTFNPLSNRNDLCGRTLLFIAGRVVMANIRVRLIIEGRVQGVWFRESTRKEAARLGVYGWVRNRPDGTVEVVAEGPEDKVRKLVTWCHHGPTSAQVTRVQEGLEVFQGEFADFDVVYFR
jgi:acylphosphatase